MGFRLFSLSVISFSVAAALLGAQAALAQASTPCVNDAPDPFQRGVSFAPLPDGRSWGSTAGVTVAPDGTIWAYDRCGANSCAGSSLDPIIAFSPDGKVLRHFGAGLLQMPHGLTVDTSGNVWVTDNAAKDGRGMQVFKFSPEGKILMTLGKPGGGEAPDGFFQPNAVAIAANGDIFVGQNHTARRQIAGFGIFPRRQIHQIVRRQGQRRGRARRAAHAGLRRAGPPAGRRPQQQPHRAVRSEIGARHPASLYRVNAQGMSQSAPHLGCSCAASPARTGACSCRRSNAGAAG